VSRTSGVCATVVCGGWGQALPAGALSVPTNTMFHTPPDQLPNCALREIHCCWLPEVTWLSILLSAMKPPLDQPPPGSRFMPPLTCARRSGAACATAHSIVPVDGTTDRFSAPRQKFCVALPWNQAASTCSAPLSVTSSGELP